MWSDRLGLLVTSAIVALLVGATIAVYAIDPTSGQSAASEAVDGRTVLMTKGCTGCHSRDGVSETAQIGPNLTGLADRAGARVEGLDAEAYVRQSVLDPQAFIVEGYGPQMPTLPLDTEELDALVEFLLG
ncbi:MAG: c-type cytochrome [Acidimicrobiia bacterium]